MSYWSNVLRCAEKVVLPGVCFLPITLHAQSNVNVRVMAANLNGNLQSYQPFAVRIFQGLKPDIVCIQEFNYNNNTAADFRSMVDTAFGTDFVYYREPYNSSGNIPNGIISRYPIIAAGSWPDTVQSQPNRGFAWAQIAVPDTNFLYVVSVHLLTSSASDRGTEAANLQALIEANFPSNAWIVVAGDFNTDSRTETPTMTTFDSYLSDNPIPVDNNGNSDTSANRNLPHDYVLPSFSFTNLETASVFPSHAFHSGLVFDSTVYTPLSDVSPVLYGDSTNAQHMAVMKDFSIPVGPATNPPVILVQPQSQTNAVGSTISLAFIAVGSGALNYQWLYNATNISGATTNPLVLTDAQLTDSGNYSVVVSNLFGSVTSTNAVLLLTNAPPAITAQPQSLSILAGQSATFQVSATGTPPLSYQWLFYGTNISGATTNPFTLANAQLADAGDYSVVITNFIGSVTSSVAVLTVASTNPVPFAQWNFNSITPDTNTTTGSTTPSLGSGVASLLGGTAATFATGDASLDPAPATDNSAWNTTSYPASGNNKSAGVQFAVSTEGRQNILITWSQRSSNTGGKYFRLRYSTNSGVNFDDFPTATVLPTAGSFYAFTNDLSVLPGVNDNSNFVFCIVAEFQSTATGSGSAVYVAANSGSSYASTGTTRFDMVTVSGSSHIGTAAASLTQPSLSNGQLTFTVNGTVGASYIVQATTNLLEPDWSSVFTNAAPFIFSDANPSAPQTFYRAVAAP